jgi:hypothetical protein
MQTSAQINLHQLGKPLIMVFPKVKVLSGAWESLGKKEKGTGTVKQGSGYGEIQRE